MSARPSHHRRVALVTGAARRVGRRIALELADAGYDVAFTYLSSQAESRSLQRQIAAKGCRALPIRVDLTEPTAAVQTIAGELQNFSRHLDVLVNSASIFQPDAAGKKLLEQMRKFWAIHVESPLILCRSLAPKLKAAGGHIINMIDLLAERPLPRYVAYCSSKAGLAAVTLGLARELAPRVTVNGIAPGAVLWPRGMPASARRQYLRRVPLARAGTPQDVARAVLFFCQSGGYVTGQILHLDGGRSLT